MWGKLKKKKRKHMQLGNNPSCFQIFWKAWPKSKCVNTIKKRTLVGSWEGVYLFVAYVDGKGNTKQGGKVCLVQNENK